MEDRIKKTLDSLKKNNFDAHFFNTKEELINYFDKIIQDDQTVSVGGSMTLFELGVIDYLRNRNLNFLDRYKEGLNQDEIENIFRHTFFSDFYLTSSNAITELGEIYNVDGKGNRVAAMLYGPKSVIVIAGINKIVKDLDEAKKRIELKAAPLNAKRLKRNTPCNKVGYCVDCYSPERICNDFVIIKKTIKGRIKVILINDNLGF